MRTCIPDQPQATLPVAVQHQGLAQERDGLDRVVVQLRDGGNGVPVPAHQLSHGGARAHPGQALILGDLQHSASFRGWS